jgi:hypothetical protein
MPGAFADPETFTGAAQGAAPTAETSLPAAGAKGEAVPRPIRNPKR